MCFARHQSVITQNAVFSSHLIHNPIKTMFGLGHGEAECFFIQEFNIIKDVQLKEQIHSTEIWSHQILRHLVRPLALGLKLI